VCLGWDFGRSRVFFFKNSRVRTTFLFVYTSPNLLKEGRPLPAEPNHLGTGQSLSDITVEPDRTN